MFSELILLISISFKDCWVKKSMKTVAIYFYVKIFKANKKFYMLRTAYFVFPFPVTDNKKDSQFLGSLELQLVAAHGFEPRTLRVWTACSSQLSYAANWSWWPGLNWWPYPYQGYALPTELHQHMKLVAGGGLEPPTFGLWARRATNCSTPRWKCWWMGLDSNQRSETRQIYSLLPLTTREPIRLRQKELYRI